MMQGVETAVVREHLARLYEDANGSLTPLAVVEDAESPASPLHAHFEWDDSVAGHKYRLEQARTLIRSVEVTIKTETLTLRAPVYVRDPLAEKHIAGYVKVADIKADRRATRHALLYECGRIEALVTRARGLAVSLGLQGDADQMIAVLTSMKSQLADV